MPSQAEIEQQQQDVDEVSALAVAEVAAVVMAVSGEDDPDAALINAIPTVLERYMVTAAQLAMDWYRGLARTEPLPAERKPGAPEPIVGPTDRISLLDAADFEPHAAELPPREQIEATVRWALHAPSPELPPLDEMNPPQRQPATPAGPATVEPTLAAPQTPQPQARPDLGPAEALAARVVPADETDLRAQVIPTDATDQQAQVISRLAGATQRYVHQAARDTITENADREGVRWARHAQSDACAFCRLLATRGPEYLTEESAQLVGTGRIRGSRKKGDLYHDDCRCEPVAVRAGDSYEPPDYVTAWETQYEKAVAAAGNRTDTKAILAAMRAAEKDLGGSTH